MARTSARRQYTALAVSDVDALEFGRAPQPVRCGFNLVIGGGEVYPEINFTLPPMAVDEDTWPAVVAQYREIGDMVVRAARRLHLPGLVVEFELLPPMTERPEWGGEITSILVRHLAEAQTRDGLRSALRATPVDIRDAVRPPLLRSGRQWETMCRSFEACAAAGAHILSVESVGGKEVHDQALLYGDVAGIMFALGVLAPRDMEFLWDMVVRTADAAGAVPGGDSACGFANTAMQLASQSMVPEVLAAIIRAASAVRSLIAFERGAIGPSKDCAYEGPIIKAIAGVPISMEGKSASCAHFSPVGNIAAAACDLWSNESVQNVRLLSGYAPEAFLELLAYDCRFFNEALRTGHQRIVQEMLVRSDEFLSPQAVVLSPASTLRIARAIVRTNGAYARTLAAAHEAFAILNEAATAGRISLSPRETEWLGKIGRALDRLPDREETLVADMMETYGDRFLKESYGL